MHPHERNMGFLKETINHLKAGPNSISVISLSPNLPPGWLCMKHRLPHCESTPDSFQGKQEGTTCTEIGKATAETHALQHSAHTHTPQQSLA